MSADDVARRRGDAWLADLADALVKNDLADPSELVGLSVEHLGHMENVAEVKLAVLRRAAKKVTLEYENSENLMQGNQSASVTMAELAKLVGGKTEPEKVTVDVGATLDSITMSGLHMDMWPRPGAVNGLATEGAKQKKAGVCNPYVYADLRKFMPLWMCQDSELMDQEEESNESGAVAELSRALGLGGGKKKTGTGIQMALTLLKFLEKRR
jgi:hypothetical protein